MDDYDSDGEVLGVVQAEEVQTNTTQVPPTPETELIYFDKEKGFLQTEFLQLYFSTHGTEEYKFVQNAVNVALKTANKYPLEFKTSDHTSLTYNSLLPGSVQTPRAQSNFADWTLTTQEGRSLVKHFNKLHKELQAESVAVAQTK